MLPSQEYLLLVLSYEEDTGELRWKKRTPDMFQSAKRPSMTCNSWNAKHSGKPVAYTGVRGYRRFKVGVGQQLAHRVIWKMVHGQEPIEVDHINGNRSDNRIANLRSVTKTQNQRNAGKRHDNTSGVVGVYWYPKYGKWLVKIGKRSASRSGHIGYFETKELAIEARRMAEEAHGYSGRNRT
jgi:hypothetical protein